MPEIIDPAEFLVDGMLREDDFLRKVSSYNWGQFADKRVLVRGCASTIMPPWVYMIITAKLATVAKSVRFGNEHDNIVVSRKE